ncbi:MAG: NAD(P)/FAD-dependent oxidoreductase [Candidatus Altiarchaeota archaeon]
MEVGIIGGGIGGLYSAYRLQKRGIKTTVFEKGEDIGGLAACTRVEGAPIERYYHHFFGSNDVLISLIRELDLQDDITWANTKMGFYCDGEIYPFGSPEDLLRFKPLKVADRLRLGFFLTCLKFLKDGSGLDGINADEWLVRWCGREAYEKIWGPLLKAKFGNRKGDVSAAWIWGRVHERAGSRGENGLKEELGYLNGGFGRILCALEQSIISDGGWVLRNSEVVSLGREGERVSCTPKDGTRHNFDRVISTVPLPIFIRIAERLPEEFRKRLAKVKYAGVICAVLRLRRPLGKYYWINISDPAIKASGVLEHTNFIGPENYGGASIAYGFNYVDDWKLAEDKTDEEAVSGYVDDFKAIFPGFRKSDVLGAEVSRYEFATPVYTTGFSRAMEELANPLPAVYVISTVQIYPRGRTIDNTLRVCDDVLKLIKK